MGLFGIVVRWFLAPSWTTIVADVAKDLKDTESKIGEAENEIALVKGQLKEAGLEEIGWLREKEQRLREEKDQLLEKKKQLREKEEQLREALLIQASLQ